MKLNPDKTLAMARAVLETEAQGIRDLIIRLDDRFVRACEHMLACTGRVVVTGMGKSGHVGGKIAATLASTGTPAFFVHPGEASHGDLGMITAGDTVLALSNSGETDELLTILPLIRRLGAPLIALTGNPHSTLAREANVHLDVSVAAEACPLGLAPTSSTTATLAMGDALAVALLEARGFTADDFARSHPGGRLGRRLLLHVGDIMHTGERIPLVRADAPLADALLEITRQGLGMTAVVDAHRNLIGVYTDGDLRRTLDRGIDIRTARIGDVMTRQCKAAQPGMLAAEALKVMEDHKISALPVVDGGQHLVGALNMHDLLRAGVV
ncbi:KpsF/GutQ family sugar-phosphate isomerase [Ectothiorhodospira marina]|uniref:Arabinose 5-phosphate isomerase n=1 Tax=Ectothiorhodospira marina TaxID=1396821 RepID=A0A1H7H607_9GAMM|nr:KpsF/GutQ family sugar-phosphate isomerase [Ectothiorhodospira marina]SEK45709.1 arabinose-5-phosphate isomerase [Ectothiorhodospira marina]